MFVKELRTGVTTGLCAAAAAKAATVALLSANAVEEVAVTAKNGETKTFAVTDAVYERDRARCAVQKDAGDDPDITHGLKIFATVSKTEGEEIEIDGGAGVGRVTKPGLKVQVGSAAINPAPREMIRSAIEGVCKTYAYSGGVRAVISIPGGREIAKKTLNERLGVVGGLSVLGTTGIVEPMSNKAIVETIKTEIDVQMASGKDTLLVTPGNYGRAFAGEVLGLDIDDAVKCANFIGETLDYACAKGVRQITLIGHAGKLVKLAGGIMNTHSAIADCRMEIIAAHCALHHSDAESIRQILACTTTQAAIEVMRQIGVNDAVWESIGQKIGYHLRERTRGSIRVQYIVFTEEHGVLCKGATG